jgi:hypothetical protein
MLDVGVSAFQAFAFQFQSATGAFAAFAPGRGCASLSGFLEISFCQF